MADQAAEVSPVEAVARSAKGSPGSSASTSSLVSRATSCVAAETMAARYSAPEFIHRETRRQG